MPAQEAALRFMMYGRDAHAPVDVLHQQFGTRLLTADDVVVAVSFSGANKHTLEAINTAKISNVPVIGVTSTAPSPLSQLADVLLIVASPSKATDPLVGRVAHSLILNGLNQAVLRRRAPDAVGPPQVLADVFARTLNE